jgi:hypothetical protein
LQENVERKIDSDRKCALSSCKAPATEDIKFIRKTKFPAKVLLCLMAVVSMVVVSFNSGLAFNEQKNVFLPDSASAHYAKDTLSRLEELKIEYVPKEQHPPNVPQLWPITEKKVH